jgi:hypothetical protein
MDNLLIQFRAFCLEHKGQSLSQLLMLLMLSMRFEKIWSYPLLAGLSSRYEKISIHID